MCPRDQHLLKVLTNGTTTVDVCVHCGGMFLDSGELDTLVGATQAMTAEQKAEWRKALQPVYDEMASRVGKSVIDEFIKEANAGTH